MKKLIPISRLALLALAVLSLGLQGCIKDRCDHTYSYMQYTPIFMPLDEFLNSVEVQAPQDLIEPGKIFVKGDILFVNEVSRGVHIIDNSDPSQPSPLAFLQVPGNYEIHSACDRLYLDSSTDLLVFDISQVDRPRFLHRVRNALPNMNEFRGYMADPNLGVVVRWEEQVVSRSFSCDGTVPDYVLVNEIDINSVDPTAMNNTRTVNPGTPGKAGSMSRFTVLNDYLYAVEPQTMQVFNLNGCDYPTKVGETSLNLPWGGVAEMVTTLENNLLVGATNGMMIYSAEVPETPTFLSLFQHVQACDPVTAQDDIAYVTLRSENSDNQGCGNSFSNQLDVINIENPSSPYLMRSFPMNNPHGVGIDGDLLFIADGDAGLRIFDAQDPMQVGQKEVASFPEMFGFDVIPFQQLLVMTGDDGIGLYDYSNPEEIKQVGSIPVTEK
ncbi:MAG: hypothetical protein AAF804_18310 [Bacteroidota bacterium]